VTVNWGLVRGGVRTSIQKESGAGTPSPTKRSLQGGSVCGELQETSPTSNIFFILVESGWSEERNVSAKGRGKQNGNEMREAKNCLYSLSSSGGKGKIETKEDQGDQRKRATTPADKTVKS